MRFRRRGRSRFRLKRRGAFRGGRRRRRFSRRRSGSRGPLRIGYRM